MSHYTVLKNYSEQMREQMGDKKQADVHYMSKEKGNF